MTPGDLVRHFDAVYRERMQGLPIVNERLSVEAVGFAALEGHELGVLISPWFMNLILLPGDDAWNLCKQGASIKIELPAGPYDFTVSHDEDVGTFLSAILFRTVSDFPDQETARAIAADIAARVFSPDEKEAEKRRSSRKLSRRELFSQLGAS